MITGRARTLAVLLGATAVGAISVGGWVSAPDPLRLVPESHLWVDGTSTVRSFTCKAAVVEATVETASEYAVPAVLGGQHGVRTVLLSVPAAKLDCGNGQMNQHMLKALKVKDHPTIEFTLNSYDLANGGDTTKAVLRGTLDLGGVKKPIVMDAALTAGQDGALRVVGAYELNMKDYELTPPTLMLGALKVRERVTVNFDLMLR